MKEYYTFDEGMMKLKDGQLLIMKDTKVNEYTVQYGKHKDGRRFWTAGWTVGGSLVKERIPVEAVRNARIWEIYDYEQPKENQDK